MKAIQLKNKKFIVKEKWRAIKEIKDYWVSSLGRVYSAKRNKILRPWDNNYGYLYVTLYKNSKKVSRRINRLVALAFLDNKQDLPQVNHKNEDKYDNQLRNLEWCTAEYNVNYGTRTIRQKETRRNGSYKAIQC